MITSTRQDVEILCWILIKYRVRALLQDSKELRQVENSRAQSLPWIPQEWALPLLPACHPALSLPSSLGQQTSPCPWGCNTGHPLKITELQRWCCSWNWFCSPGNEQGSCEKLQVRFPVCCGFVELNLFMPLNFKTWWSKCDSKPARGEECWERNR